MNASPSMFARIIEEEITTRSTTEPATFTKCAYKGFCVWRNPYSGERWHYCASLGECAHQRETQVRSDRIRLERGKRPRSRISPRLIEFCLRRLIDYSLEVTTTGSCARALIGRGEWAMVEDRETALHALYARMAKEWRETVQAPRSRDK